jgi:uroporphyrinogen-III decarboxylase
MGMGDDNATEINPFISYEFFCEFLLPRYKRVADKLTEAGKVVSYHNCGRCEDFMDDMAGIGVQVWNCATPVNDLNAFKAKYDNKIILEVMPRLYPDATEDETRAAVRGFIDAYAPGGAFIWIGGSSTMNAEIGGQVDEWVYDEVKAYGKGYYA